MEFEKIKLVIWDLDKTFWSGILSEVGEIQPITQNIELVKLLTDNGIINSVCSKNTFEVGAKKLKELEIFDYFVFPSIDWNPKGMRIVDMIKSMSLRAENVLFIDDDITNLEEVKHYSPTILTALPDIIPDLYQFAEALDKKDINHTRLEQYKLLEKKHVDKKNYQSNEDFLYACNIKAEIKYDCIQELERIHDLLQRSNQLNYTKKRISKDELKLFLENENARCGYVVVNDKFGKYGIVGFYGVLNNKLEHFLFSCRVIGLGIEQYVYSKLDNPTLDVVGEVLHNVENIDAPDWINQEDDLEIVDDVIEEKDDNRKPKYLFKSNCSFSQIIAYIKNRHLFHCEFNYVSNKWGSVIEGHNHSVHIATFNDLSSTEKEEIINDCVFTDDDMFKSSIYTEKYHVVFLSTLYESFAGIYRKKNSNIEVTTGYFTSPLTDEKNWEGLINGTLYAGNNKYTKEFLKNFSEKYEFVGKTTPADYRNRINKILSNLDSQTKICLILGVEFPCEKTNSVDTISHVSHALLNKEIRLLAQENPRILLLDLNDIVKNQADFKEDLNHFTLRVNYEISQKITSIINDSCNSKIENYPTYLVYFDIMLNYIKRVSKWIIPNENIIYKNLQSAYNKLSRKEY